MARIGKRSREMVDNNGGPSTSESGEEIGALNPKRRWTLRWESETKDHHASSASVVDSRSLRGNRKTPTGETSGAQLDNCARPSTFESEEKTAALKRKTRWRLRWESETKEHYASSTRVVGSRSLRSHRRTRTPTGEPSRSLRGNKSTQTREPREPAEPSRGLRDNTGTPAGEPGEPSRSLRGNTGTPTGEPGEPGEPSLSLRGNTRTPTGEVGEPGEPSRSLRGNTGTPTGEPGEPSQSLRRSRRTPTGEPGESSRSLRRSRRTPTGEPGERGELSRSLRGNTRTPTGEPGPSRSLKRNRRTPTGEPGESSRSLRRNRRTPTGEPSGAQFDNRGGPSICESKQDIKKKYKGLNFYKRLGFWAINIWDRTVTKPYQLSIGSYPTAAEAARAYDKASLKLHGRSINLDISEYGRDIEEMGAVDKKEYIGILRSRASISEADYVSEGITACPWGWYEAKIKDPSAPQNWLFVGRFLDLEDAKKFQMAALEN